MRQRICLALAIALAASACGGAQPKAEPMPVVAASGYRVESAASGLAFPWGLAFLPDGALLVTQRDGALTRIQNGQKTQIAGLPTDIFVDGQAGLFDVALHPNFAQTQWVYLSYASGTRSENATSVARARLLGDALADLEVIFKASPRKRGSAHFGGRLLFLPDGSLLLTLGDGYDYRNEAQNRSSHLGKIVRMTDTGAPAPGNPFLSEGGPSAYVYTYGHRNVQGLVRDPLRGRVYAHEHGPRGGDEINVLEPGGNYGWPIATYGVDYSGAQISPFTERDGTLQPLLYWVPSIAPSGMAFYDGELFPQWRGDLFVSALVGQHLRRVDLDQSGAVAAQEILLADRQTRLRHVAQGPDGALYILTDEPEGEVLRIAPEPSE